MNTRTSKPNKADTFPAQSETAMMARIVSLCKRRGFVFQSSEIYGGLKSCYDYGPLGVELKKNIATEWWQNMVYERENIHGLDASVMMHTDAWKSSGHIANFSDPLVDCKNCQERFRADKAPTADPGSKTSYIIGGKSKGQKASGTVGECGYVCPSCGSNELSGERNFSGMFRSTMGALDPLSEMIEKISEKLEKSELSRAEVKKIVAEAVDKDAIYLRPETAQSMFVQFTNVQQTTSAKIPFGIAQHGKSFRNEIVVEHFIFRSCEFEQMEMEFFCEPGTQDKWMEYWKQERMDWYHKFARNKDAFRLRKHEGKELAHYSTECYDVEYKYPWGWDELEGIASRTDYDLTRHSKGSGAKLSYFDQQKQNPETGKTGWRYTPYVIEPAAGLTRAFLMFLLDAYEQETLVDANGKEKIRDVLKLHPRLAPFKAAILPLVKKDGQPEKAREIAKRFRAAGLNVSYDDVQSIGKRYAKHDEIGTPYCLTVDNESLTSDTVTIRDRDTTQQQRIPVADAISAVLERLNANM